jgi:hypothetical protein
MPDSLDRLSVGKRDTVAGAAGRLNWKPIRKVCVEAAQAMGHKLSGFDKRKSTPSVRTAMCETCYGCCWIAYSSTRGFGAGGRLLKYRCGTPEAAGQLV